jgi:lipopolysaccharide transport system ATP-binding protein
MYDQPAAARCLRAKGPGRKQGEAALSKKQFAPDDDEEPLMDSQTASATQPIVIKLDAASKTFQLHQSPWSRVAAALSRSLGRGFIKPRSEHRAVDGVSFTVRKGETVGLLGVNGAGKSTLLQLITGTLTPTSGTVSVDGRISALLELGAGFNPEWSGRRNAELQCILSGVPQDEVAERIRAIADFADIGDFFDQPTRTYSSGMFLRVAFASAISTNPDILIVDEALAVGDVKFQNKCFRRFEDLQAQGCTVLFVSHAPDLVTRFCTRGIILHQGRILFDGDTRETVRTYYNLTTNAALHQEMILPEHEHAAPVPTPVEAAEPDVQLGLANQTEQLLWAGHLENRQAFNPEELRSGNGKGRIVDALLHKGDFVEIKRPIRPGETVNLSVRYAILEELEHPEFGIVLRSSTNQILSGASNRMLVDTIDSFEKSSIFDAHWRFTANFLNGEYFIDFGIANLDGNDREVYDLRQSALHFSIMSLTKLFGLVEADIALLGYKRLVPEKAFSV